MVSSNASTNFFRVNGADALHHAAAEVFLDALPGGGRGAGEHLRLELEAELPVLHPAALGGHPFARADGGQRADDRHQVSVPFDLRLEDDEARVLVPERITGARPPVAGGSDSFAYGERFGNEGADPVVGLGVGREHQRPDLLDVRHSVAGQRRLVHLHIHDYADKLGV